MKSSPFNQTTATVSQIAGTTALSMMLRQILKPFLSMID